MKDKKTKVVKSKKEKVLNPKIDKTVKKTIDSYNMAVAHHVEASNHLLEAVKYYEAGNSEKAAHHALLAHGHHAIAGDFLTDEAKHHAQTLKRTNYRN